MNLKELAKQVKDYKLTLDHATCVFGNPKTGKTTYVAQLAKCEHINKIHWFDFEGGYTTLLNDVTGLSEDQLEKIQLHRTTDGDAPYIIETAMQLFGYSRSTKLCETHGRFDCALCKRVKDAQWDEVPIFGAGDIVVIDSLTAVTDSATLLAQIKSANSNDKYAFYRIQGEALLALLRGIQNTRASVVCITHVSVGEDEATKREMLAPLIGTRNLSLKAGRFFGNILYKEVSGRKFRTYGDPLAKSNVIMGTRVNADPSDDGVTITDFVR